VNGFRPTTTMKTVIMNEIMRMVIDKK
jgi:hypothetical protein